MRKWGLALLGIVCLFVVVLIAGSASASGSGEDYPPPASGDWVVDSVTTVQNEDVTLNGDLLIQNGGVLTLDDCTLVIHSTSNGEFGIYVNGSNGGALNLYHTMIKANEHANGYRFEVFDNADLDIDYCQITDGYGPDVKPHSATGDDFSCLDTGLRIDSNKEIFIRHSAIYNSEGNGISLWNDCNVTIENCGISTNQLSGITHMSYWGIMRGNLVVRNSYFDNNALSILPNDKGPDSGNDMQLQMYYSQLWSNAIVAISIENCDVNQSNGYGLYIQGVSDATISNCTVWYNSFHGLVLKGYKHAGHVGLVENNFFYHNGWVLHGRQGRALLEYSPTFFYDTINVTARSNRLYYCFGSAIMPSSVGEKHVGYFHDNIIIGLRAAPLDEQYHTLQDIGIVIQKEDKSWIFNNYIANCSGDAISVSEDCDPLIFNNTIVNCGWGLSYYNNNKYVPKFWNNTIIDSNETDVWVTNSSQIDSLQNGFSIASCDEISSLKVNWFLNVGVLDSDGVALPGALVSVYDNYGAIVFAGESDASGQAEWIEITEYIISYDQNDYLTPHTIVVEKDGMSSSVLVNVSGGLDIEITLGNLAPYFNNLPDEILAVADGSNEFDLTPYIGDPDNPLEDLRISEDSQYIEVNGHVLTLTYPSSVTTEDVTITLADGILARAGEPKSTTATIRVRVVDRDEFINPVFLFSPLSTSSSSIELEWTQNTDDNFKSYKVYSGKRGGDFTLLTTMSSADYTSYTASGLDADTGYIFRVDCENTDGNSNPSNVGSGWTRPSEYKPVTISEPKEGTKLEGVVTIRTDIHDLMDADKVEFYIRERNERETLLDTDSVTPFEATVDTSLYSGACVIFVKAYTHDNVFYTDHVSVILSASFADKGIIQILAPKDNEVLTGVVTITIQVHDRIAPFVTSVDFYILNVQYERTLLGSDDSAPYEIQLDTSEYPDGGYVIEVRVRVREEGARMLDLSDQERVEGIPKFVRISIANDAASAKAVDTLAILILMASSIPIMLFSAVRLAGGKAIAGSMGTLAALWVVVGTLGTNQGLHPLVYMSGFIALFGGGNVIQFIRDRGKREVVT